MLSSVSGSQALQSMVTKAFFRSRLSLWMHWARRFLPLPVSPVSRMGAENLLIRLARSNRAWVSGSSQMMLSKLYRATKPRWYSSRRISLSISIRRWPSWKVSTAPSI